MKNLFRHTDKRSIMTILGSGVILTLVLVIAIVVFMTQRNQQKVLMELTNLSNEGQTLNSGTQYGIEDFYRDVRNPEHASTYPLREKQKFWTDSQVDSYWIPPADAGIDTLTLDNDALIRKVLGPPKGNDSP